jgi:hypothetical protein
MPISEQVVLWIPLLDLDQYEKKSWRTKPENSDIPTQLTSKYLTARI